MASNYDNASWFYDRLSRVVYGKALINAQNAFLHLIPAKSNILIAGGGTGRIIEDIATIHPSGLQITYVEISKKMMALSKERNTGKNNIHYINAAVESAGLEPGFDVVITPFLMDNFTPETFDKVFSTLHHLLKPAGLWLNTDFQLTGKWWQKLLLTTMYSFFNLLGCMETSYLPAIKQRFKISGYEITDEKTFFGDFMITTAYIKK